MHPTTSDMLASAQAGTRIHRYELIRPLGQGGMAMVWLAKDWISPAHALYALKIPLQGHIGTQARFARECAILSALDHAHIAQLQDSGTDSVGWPYLVMEYVDGIPIDEWCRTQRLDCTAILSLFGQVLDAVQYAHEQLVLHRDLKPSNILVTRQGQAKLLDFGIAKLLHQEHQEQNGEHAITQWTGRVWTPAYSAPEVLAGDTRPGPSSDIYSLGVVLYELLTGHSPYREALSRGWPLERAIAQHRPLPPSRTPRIPLETDRLWSQTQRQALRGPVDRIVLSALQKTSRLRYESAHQFGEDIRRHLKGQPILAESTPWQVRLANTFTEHRGLIQAVGAICLVSLVGAGIAGWQAHQAFEAEARAERHFDNIRKLTTSLLFDVYRDIEWLPGGDKARLAIASSAQKYLDMLLSEDIQNPDLMTELSTAYSTLAHAQSNNVSFELQQALTNAQHAWALSMRVIARFGPTPERVRTAQKTGLRMTNYHIGMLDRSRALQQFDQVHQLISEHAALAETSPAEFGIFLFNYHTSKAALLMLSPSGKEASESEIDQARHALEVMREQRQIGPEMAQRLQGDWARMRADWLMEFAPPDRLLNEMEPLIHQAINAWRPMSTHERRLQQGIVNAGLQMVEAALWTQQYHTATRWLNQWATSLDALLKTDEHQSAHPVMALRRDLFQARLSLHHHDRQNAQDALARALARLDDLDKKKTFQIYSLLLRAEYLYLDTEAQHDKQPPRATTDDTSLHQARAALLKLQKQQMLNRYGTTLLHQIESALAIEPPTEQQPSHHAPPNPPHVPSSSTVR